MEPTLHPNLAKLAAAYDEICERYGRGEMNAAQSRAEILALEARDDQGVRWSIDPDTGEWVRRTALGQAQADAPPQWGLETPDAFDFTRDPRAFDPDERVSKHAVDENLLFAPAGLAGATRAAAPDADPASGGVREVLAGISWKLKTAAVIAALAIGYLVTGGGAADPAPTAPDGKAPTTATATKAPVKAPAAR